MPLGVANALGYLRRSRDRNSSDRFCLCFYSVRERLRLLGHDRCLSPARQHQASIGSCLIDRAYRGRGHAGALLNAFVAEARSRAVRQIGLARYDFQASGHVRKGRLQRMAEFEGWPEGHINVVLCKTLLSREN